MTNALEIQHLITSASALGWSLDVSHAQDLLTYRDLLLAENKRVNLTGVRDPQSALETIVLDSLAVGLHLRDSTFSSAPVRLADLGSGGGVPGLVIALAARDMEVHLVESRTRKAEALTRIVTALKVDDRVTVHHGRFRQIAALENAMDLVTARAVARLGALIEETRSALAPTGGILLAYKTWPVSSAEITEAERTAKKRGLSELNPIPYEVFKPSALIRYQRGNP